MGLFSSKEKPNAANPLARISPFGRFCRRSFQQSRHCRECVEGSLLSLCVDALCLSLHLQDHQALQKLPLDLSQLILDNLIETGRLNDAAVLRLQGQHFYELCLDSYQVDIRDFWVRFLVTETLEVLILSRTTVDDFVLGAFPTLRRLRTLQLDWCYGITDAGLTVLGRLPGLEDLSLAGCDGIGPLSIGWISRLPNLRRLNLDACHKIWGLGPLRRCTKLESLDLGWCNAIGNEDAAALASLVHLSHLCLNQTSMNQTGVSKLATLTKLTSLSLGGLDLSDDALAGLLRTMTCLRKLNISRCADAGDATMRALSATCSESLEDLCLAYTNVSDEGLLQSLPALSRLRRLDLDSCSVGDSGLAALSSLHSLSCIDLSDTGAGSVAMSALARLPVISQVNLSFTDINDFALQRLCKATSLRSLNLDSRTVTDAGLVHVARLPHLEILDLFGATISDAGCAHVARAKSLRSLELCSGAVTDAGVAKLSELRGLRHLSVAQNFRVGNGCIPSLMKLTCLTALNLSDCRVSGPAVVTLGCLPHLQVLCLAGTRVRQAAVEKLQAMNVNLEVKGVKLPDKYH